MSFSQSFADLGVTSVVVQALARRGVVEPFAVQRSVVPDVLAGHDVLVKSPTGSGKTLAFAVPIVDLVTPSDVHPAALVLAPTRELASQIVDELADIAESRGLRASAVYGGTSVERQRRHAASADVLVATPGRLEDLIARGAVTLEHVRLLVLDEADRMLDMGFRPAVDRIVACTSPERQTLFFSATLDGEAGRIARAYTKHPRLHDHAAPPERRGDVEHRFVPVAQTQKVARLVTELHRGGRARTLVFVRTKRGADRLVRVLSTHDVAAVAMRGNKSQGQRERALASFDSGRVDTLVATDVAARGIHVDGITHVINYDAPADRDGYVHRVGRTGRAGRGGTAITFVTAEQASDVAGIAAELALASEFRRTGFADSASTAGGLKRSRPRTGRRSQTATQRSSPAQGS